MSTRTLKLKRMCKELKVLIIDHNVLKLEFLQPGVGLCHSIHPRMDVNTQANRDQIKVRKMGLPSQHDGLYSMEPSDEYSRAHHVAISNENMFVYCMLWLETTIYRREKPCYCPCVMIEMPIRAPKLHKLICLIPNEKDHILPQNFV